jgi:dTDP-4-dehydrorhamnose 3,5-epimerase
MKVLRTELPGVLILEPRVFGDERGFFFEAYNRRDLQDAIGIDADFVQDNHSRSVKGVLRGLHYQIRQPQGKLVRVLFGEIYDVAVDLRGGEATFGKWIATSLSAENKRSLWISPGFAHGFLVVSEAAEVLYKTTDFYAPKHERSILWSDPDVAIPWPLRGEPLVSAKDAEGQLFRDAEVFQ